MKNIKKITYGLPYMGSKRKLADKICQLFPKRKNFYDLFFGGGAVSHCAILHNQFEEYYANDLDADMPQFFLDALCGKYENENRWISREDFFDLKESDVFVRVCWSFGNDKDSYMYGKDVEEIKKAVHYARVFNDYSLIDKLQNDSKRIRSENIGRLNIVKSLRLQNIERLNIVKSLRLQNIERLNIVKSHFHISGKSYDEAEIQKDSVIYCDIPYFRTKNYGNIFDYEKFYDWCSKQTESLFISSYDMPEDKFISIAKFEHLSLQCASKTQKIVEKVFIPIHQIDQYNSERINLDDAF